MKIRRYSPYREEIGGRSSMEFAIRTAVEDRGVAGEHRIRTIEVLAGETEHDNGSTSTRPSISRRPGSRVFQPTTGLRTRADCRPGARGRDGRGPFAGVGPYAILIARRRNPRQVHASDANAAAVGLLRTNVAANRADRVVVRQGDARKYPPGHRASRPDRPRPPPTPPSSSSRRPWRPSARAAPFICTESWSKPTKARRVKQIQSAARNAGMKITALGIHRVRAYSPTQHHVAFDVTVARTSRPSGLGKSQTADRTSPKLASRGSRKRPARTAPRSGSRGRQKKR